MRHKLNDKLLKHGGHIGYVVVPSYRGCGVASIALELCLQKAREIGIEQALLTCDANNQISKHIIEKTMKKFGGRQDNSEKDGEVTVLRYWINTYSTAGR